MEYRFHDCIVNTERQEIQLHGETIRLQTKAFQILLYLIAQRDRVVSRKELFTHIWHQRCVSDSALTTCIKNIRYATGDTGHEQKIIKTLHGRGYRFVASLLESQKPIEEFSQNQPEPRRFSREYKNITVLNCALAGVKQLYKQLDPETIDAIMQSLIQQISSTMDRYQGTISQWLDDGFVALFGAPTAFEDHARRAVLAGLEVQQKNGSWPEIILPRIGIHSGSVVIGTLEDQTSTLYTPPCATTQLAAQLQQQATAGDILISKATYHLIAEEIQATTLMLEGRACYRVLKVEKKRAGVLQTRPRTPFIGRKRELAMLHERLTHVQEGHGQIVAVVGPPGIGKSRLVNEFRRSLADGYDYYQSHCLSYATTRPFFPILGLLRQVCGIEPQDSAKAVIARLLAAGFNDEYTLCLLAHFLDLDTELDKHILQQVSPQAQREHLLQALCRLMLNSGTSIIVLEDLHWLDASSQEWLNRLAAQLATSRVLLVLTYRPGLQPDWLKYSWVSKFALPPLTQQASTQLVNAVAQTRALSISLGNNNVAANIVVKAEGNPFFLEELTWNVAANTDSQSKIPDTVQDVLAARIDRLPANAKQLLQTAAVIGVHIPARLLLMVSEFEPDAFEHSLQQLQGAEFLFESFESTEALFRFKHILTQEVAYQSLLKSAKVMLHQKIATTLQTRFANEIAHQPELLALHFTAAAEYPAAVDYWQRASRRAYERSAYLEAIEYAQQGLDLLTHLSDDVTRTNWELRLLMSLGPALMAAQGYAAPQVNKTWQRAQQLCQQSGNQTDLFRVLVGLWNFYWVSGRLDQAIATADQLLALAEESGDNIRRLRAHAAMGEVLLHTGKPATAWQHLEQGLALFHQSVTQTSYAINTPSVACLDYSAWTRWHLGYPDQALQDARQALALAEELRQPFSLVIALSLLAELHQFRLEPDATLDFSERAIALSREQGFPFWEGTALVLQGWGQALLGQPSTGSATVQQGIRVFRATGAQVQLSSWYGILAEVYHLAGQTKSALQSVDEALQWVDKTGECYYQSELYRLRAKFIPDQHQAEQELQQAMTIAHQQGAKIRELRAATDIGCIWYQQNRWDDVRTLIQPLYNNFTEGLTTPDLQMAAKLLSDCAIFTKRT